MRKELKDGYNIIASNRTFVQFDNAGDEELYTKENAETRTKRMASVIDVFFVDFLKGRGIPVLSGTMWCCPYWLTLQPSYSLI